VEPGLDFDHALGETVCGLLERQRQDGWHRGAQCYVSLRGETALDVAIGESAPDRPLETTDVMLWYSSGKPFTTVAILQLWEQGRLALDDPVARFIPSWGNGKEHCTLRHVLVHTGGFPMWGDPAFDHDEPYAEAVARIAAAPAAWEPGTAAGYHPVTAWKILGAVVEAVDGRPIARYVHDEIAVPLGLDATFLGIPVDVQVELGPRIVPVEWRGHMMPNVEADGTFSMVPYHVDRVHNEPWHIAKVEPAGGMRGPARELGAFYESLLGHGPALLAPTTVELMTKVHRWGLRDAVFAFDAPWALGMAVDFSGGTGWRAYGHGGMASSRAIADPECGLVMVVVANGLPGFFQAEQRVTELTDAVYRALGPAFAPRRRPTTPRAAGSTMST
jgi:CubicO group peptidase (beta-lactamase class C family)